MKTGQCAEQHYALMDEKTEVNRQVADLKHVQWKK